jgi:hypothetical protein
MNFPQTGNHVLGPLYLHSFWYREYEKHKNPIWTNTCHIPTRSLIHSYMHRAIRYSSEIWQVGSQQQHYSTTDLLFEAGILAPAHNSKFIRVELYRNFSVFQASSFNLIITTFIGFRVSCCD